MANIFSVPSWFFGYDAIFELFFAVITLAVALYAFKVYKLSNQNQPKLFGIAFLSFSASYCVQSVLNFLILNEASQNVYGAVRIQILALFNSIGLYLHMFFFIFGLVTLTYMTLRIKSPKTYVLLLASFLLTFFVVANKMSWFYMVSSLLLIFISIYYLSNFIENKQPKTFLVFLAFLFLLFGHLHFILSVNHALYYAIGHFLELLAYIFILTNLVLILKNGKKKK